MDPNTINTQPNFDLPEPIAPDKDSAPNSSTDSKELSVTNEKPAQEMGKQAPQTAGPMAPPLSTPIPVSDSTASSTADPMTPATNLIADDVDLIEKEWVTKAKAIVGQTKDNPHLQNKELNKVKADYIKKRYNKDVKVSEE